MTVLRGRSAFGANENANGLLRPHLPHGMTLRDVTQQQRNDIAARPKVREVMQ